MQEPSIHSAIILTREGVWGQAIGIPTPPGVVAYIPKYVDCRKQSPWKYLSWRLCRVIPSYGPKGLENVMESLGLNWREDPLYGARMPYVLLDDIVLFIHPREALLHLISNPRAGFEPAIEVINEVVRKTRGSVEELGITGSYAMGTPHSKSDLDLIVYGEAAVVKMYDYFKRESKGPSREDLGGITTYPTVDLSWRRRSLNGFNVTWTGVPISWHCPPLRDYYMIQPPERLVKVRVWVDPEQTGALLYPPCVNAGEYWIVSYEYNLGGMFYEGGAFELSAMSSHDNVLYVGLREYPGLVRRLGSSGD